MDAPLRQFTTDSITEVLDRLYLPEWSATELVLDPPWGIAIPAGTVSMFVILQGEGYLQLEKSVGDPVHLISGDHAIVTRGEAHRLTRDRAGEALPIEQLQVQSRWNPRARGESTAVLVAQFRVDCLTQNPLYFGLPDLVQLNHRRDKALATCLPLLDLIQQTQRQAQGGSPLRVRKLAQLIFIETLAEELSRGLESGAVGDGYQLLHAITDPAVGPVLKALVDRPADPWSVPGMARMARISRSAFSERFRNLVGLPPLQFLTEIRMQNACQLLRESDIEISNISSLVGYESPASFSNAFKRWRGSSPVDYRRTAGEAGSFDS